MKYNQSALKWAGSKQRVLPELLPLFEKHLKANPNAKFVEPFTGSATVAINVNFSKKTINDINQDIKVVMESIKNHAEELIAYLETLFIPANATVARYLELRSQFNTRKFASKIEQAGLFIYLNKHCFNGLCRYNSKGDYNTPPHSCCKTGVGPKVPAEQIRTMAVQLQNTKICNKDFLQVMDEAQDGDLIYADPPYFGFDKEEDTPTSFVNYSKEGFGMLQQFALAQKAAEKAKEGVTVIISNHATGTAINLYRELGAKLYFVGVARSVGASSATRQVVKEVIAVFSPKNKE
jgi:DNA adenine methylase